LTVRRRSAFPFEPFHMSLIPLLKTKFLRTCPNHLMRPSARLSPFTSRFRRSCPTPPPPHILFFFFDILLVGVLSPILFPLSHGFFEFSPHAPLPPPASLESEVSFETYPLLFFPPPFLEIPLPHTFFLFGPPPPRSVFFFPPFPDLLVTNRPSFVFLAFRVFLLRLPRFFVTAVGRGHGVREASPPPPLSQTFF